MTIKEFAVKFKQIKKMGFHLLKEMDQQAWGTL